jgi:hypothetical protein
VNRLRETLQLTKEYLAKAQTRVHRNVAPLLAASVSTRLSHVTHGRYADVVVDPQDLMVHVRLPDGASVPAQLLSHGTAEQVYLLLRVAMVERLAKQDEPCPLVMDDITVQSDTQRTTAILETLQMLAGERQIILFTQEDASVGRRAPTTRHRRSAASAGARRECSMMREVRTQHRAQTRSRMRAARCCRVAAGGSCPAMASLFALQFRPVCMSQDGSVRWGLPWM